MRIPSSAPIEILEARIAPALFFIQSNALTVLDAAGNNAQDLATETAAKTTANSTTAVLLKTGDKLIFDADNNHVQNAGDEELVRITGGSALVFLTDTLGGVNGHFDKNEISGLAVSNGFNATIHADVRGGIVTALDSTGAFTASGAALDVQHGASIAGLTVTGKIGGAGMASVAHILAGGSIANVTGGTKLLSNGPDVSIDGFIATGTSTQNKNISLNGGGKTFSAQFTVNPGEKGGDITNVTLPKGYVSLLAGGGGPSPTAPGKGGSITNVTVANATLGVGIIAGHGGNNTGVGAGGAGGSVMHIKVTAIAAASDTFLIDGGIAGDAAKGTGGIGGMIKDLQLNFTGTTASVLIGSGYGGNSSNGAGGAGGAIVGSTIHGGSVNNNLFVSSGHGGNGGGAGAGGLGGAMTGVIFSNGTAGNSATIAAGDGGTGGANGGKGGLGGALSGSNITFTGAVTGNLVIASGTGGDGGNTKGAGGNAGALTGTTITTQGVSTLFEIDSGSGGDSYDAAGGKGGAMSGVKVENLGFVHALDFSTGSGGFVISGNGTGGTGGSASGLTYKNTGGVDTFVIAAQTGGTGHNTGNGGAGGALTTVTVTSIGDVTTSGKIGAFNGSANAGATLGNGGLGGKVSAITFHDQRAGGAAGDIFVFGGEGGDGFGATGKGGPAGNVGHVTLDGAKTKFYLGEDSKSGGFRGIGGDGGTGAAAQGGTGSSVATVKGTAGQLVVLGRDGGTATNGKGGNGGNVSGLTITNSDTTVTMISGGKGGDGVIKAGGGGNVSTVNVAGDIGRFNATFNAAIGSAGMGGLFAGQAGSGGGVSTGVVHNGSITTVTAGRIAAILAGHPSTTGLVEANAVFKISGVKVTSLAVGSKLGADVNNTGFSFTNAGTAGLNPGDGDTMIDGFVIVRKSGLTATSFGGAVPLDLIQVV